MKRFHVNVTVADLAESTRFYTTLFGSQPNVSKDDYVKWMLDDPRINFSISSGGAQTGINHLGIQADTMPELGQIQDRLAQAGEQTVDQPEAECCYAKSSKTWVRDPDNVAWETFVTHGENTVYGDDRVPGESRLEEESDSEIACCPTEQRDCCIPERQANA